LWSLVVAVGLDTVEVEPEAIGVRFLGSLLVVGLPLKPL
jgi:hypothetical protein